MQNDNDRLPGSAGISARDDMCACAHTRIFLTATAFFLSIFNIQPHLAADTPEKKATPLGNTTITLKNYIRYPAFNAQGYRTHLIHGAQAKIHGTEQVDVTDLSFTQYPGDGSTVVITRITAPSASIVDATGPNPTISGKESVRLSYENELEASGDDWTYNHAHKKIIIRKNARIVYQAPLKNILGHAANPPSAPAALASEQTVITATALELAQNETGSTTLAVFTGNVIIETTDGMRLACEHLEVTAARLTDKNPELQPIDKFQHLVASGNVRITQGERTITCGRADVSPRENRITLTQSPVLTDATVHVTASGDPLTLLRDSRRVEGKNVRITLPPWEKTNAAQGDTVITSKEYVMWETDDGLTHASLDGDVSVVTTETRLACNHLDLIIDPAKPQSATPGSPQTLRHLLATGNVRIEQTARSITCGSAEILPLEDKLILTETPVLTDHAASATATANIFVVRQAEQRITGEKIKITLPSLKDLSAKTEGNTQTPAAAEAPTIITSNTFTMWSTPDKMSHAMFDDDVHLAATNLDLTCNHLVLDADPAKTPPATGAPENSRDAKLENLSAKLLSMIATGVVRFKQPARDVSCERAAIIPPEDRITLTGNPLIIDHEQNIMVTGETLNLIRGQGDYSGEKVQITGAPVKLP